MVCDKVVIARPGNQSHELLPIVPLIKALNPTLPWRDCPCNKCTASNWIKVAAKRLTALLTIEKYGI